MPRFRNINGVKVQFTQAEEIARDAKEAQYVIDRQARADAAAQKATLKASAKAKLIAGEALTEAEADTIVI
jgi:secreted protein with Ig-like and vWFA domain